MTASELKENLALHISEDTINKTSCMVGKPIEDVPESLWTFLERIKESVERVSPNHPSINVTVLALAITSYQEFYK